MSRSVGITLRSAVWLVLGVWVGSWLSFAFVVAPTAFRVLPSTEMAGTMVGPVLSILHLYGAAAGIALGALAAALRRGVLLSALPLVLAAICLVSHFGVSAEIAEVRDLAFGPEGTVDGAARFNQLHRVSLWLYGAALAGAIALVPLHVRAETPATRLSESSNSV